MTAERHLLKEVRKPFVAPEFGPLDRTALIEAFKSIGKRDLEIFALLSFGIRDHGPIARQFGFTDIESHPVTADGEGIVIVESSAKMNDLKNVTEQKIINWLVAATVFPEEPENTAWRNGRLLNYLMDNLQVQILGPRPETKKAGRFSTIDEIDANMKECQERDDRFVEWIKNLQSL